MFPLSSSSAASSPFSNLSTDASSPEAGTSGGETKPSPTPGRGLSPMSQVMQALQMPRSNGSLEDIKPYLNGIDAKPINPPSSIQLHDVKPNTSSSIPPPSASASSSRQVSRQVSRSSTKATSHGGGRAEKPKRDYPVEGWKVLSPGVADLLRNPERNILFLQGDPQHLEKSRVETAIRASMDLLVWIPPTPETAPSNPSMLAICPRDVSGNVAAHLARIGTFKSIHMQAGTTTKTISSKMVKEKPSPEQIVYLDTAVYTTGSDSRRVYACKRCRAREAGRKKKKEEGRKKPQSGSESSSSNPPQNGRPALAQPSPDYVTGANPEHYDQGRKDQVVEEPPWDPTREDWRHDFVSFNTAPEVLIKDGSVESLPFRMICYAKCHGEKIGFQVRFTLRTLEGTQIATHLTHPIRITDDHKTSKSKILSDNANGFPPAPRSRKGRQSVVSSRRTSPAPSEAESIQSLSEAGAVLQKQTPQVRAGKPYERPSDPLFPMQSPTFRRHNSSTSLHSMTSISSAPVVPNFEQSNGALFSADWPASAETLNQGMNNVPLRRPLFPGNGGFTPINGANPFGVAAPQSMAASHVASPAGLHSALTEGPNLLGEGANPDLSAALISQLGQFVQNPGQTLSINSEDPTLFTHDYTSQFQTLGQTLSPTSFASNSFHDGTSSSFSSQSALGLQTGEGSYTTSEGEEGDMENYIDFSGGDLQLHQPFASPPLGAIPNHLPFDFTTDLSLRDQSGSMSPRRQMEQNSQLAEMLRAFNPSSVPAPPPQQPTPTINLVIPANGPMVGGIPVAIGGANFTTTTRVLFGGRPAETNFQAPSLLTCVLPPSTTAGQVEVTIQDVTRPLNVPAQSFTYDRMDEETMRLALQVRNAHQGTADHPAYKLAERITRGSTHAGGEWSDRSSQSPAGGGGGTDGIEAKQIDDPDPETAKDCADLQLTIIDFLASLDSDTPGSLRRSGAINTRNAGQQTLLHLATVMGFHRLVRRLIVIGAHLDLQDVNGFTPLAFAALCGQTNCARVLIEAGAAYDPPTTLGEMPLDLAKSTGHIDVEKLLLSAVWSTALTIDQEQEPELEPELPDTVPRALTQSRSEIDDDNPSSESDSDVEAVSVALPRRKRSVGKQRVVALPSSLAVSPPRTRRSSLDSTPQPTPHMSPTPKEDPPPYSGPIPDSTTSAPHPHPHQSSWFEPPFKLPIQLPQPLADVWPHIPIPAAIPIPGLALGLIPSFLIPDSLDPNTKSGAGSSGTRAQDQGQTSAAGGWVAFPAPSWETLSKMTSPEEVKLFTQAMAAAAFNAVIQSGATTSATSDFIGVGVGGQSKDSALKKHKRGGSTGERKRKSRQASESSNTSGVSREQVVKQVKKDRMLYLFWLPILLFVGFWLMVTALPLATGFCLIYARQITRAIKQRM